MPPLPDVPGVLRIFIEGKVDTENIYNWGNVMHFKWSGTTPSSLSLVNVASQVATEWGIYMAPECPSPTTLTKVVVTDLTSHLAGEAIWTGATAGTRGDDSIPANAAMLLSYPAPARWRGGHPRQYLYIGGNADLEGAAKWSTLFFAEGLAHWKSFITGIQGYSTGGTTIGTICMVSYVNGGARRAVPVVYDLDVTSSYTAQEIASQRRRVGRRKAHR